MFLSNTIPLKKQLLQNLLKLSISINSLRRSNNNIRYSSNEFVKIISPLLELSNVIFKLMQHITEANCVPTKCKGINKHYKTYYKRHLIPCKEIEVIKNLTTQLQLINISLLLIITILISYRQEQNYTYLYYPYLACLLINFHL